MRRTPLLSVCPSPTPGHPLLFLESHFNHHFSTEMLLEPTGPIYTLLSHRSKDCPGPGDPARKGDLRWLEETESRARGYPPTRVATPRPLSRRRVEPAVTVPRATLGQAFRASGGPALLSPVCDREEQDTSR